MKVLVLTTDAFGGHGGIAKYNRDLLTALCSSPQCARVFALVRNAPLPLEPMPDNLELSLEGINGKLSYARALLSTLARVRDVDLVICGHVNLLPLAYVAALRYRARMALLLYGIEVWSPPSRLRQRLVERLASVVSISETTASRFFAWAALDRAKLTIVPNAIDASAFAVGDKPAPLVARYHLEGCKVLTSFGRLAASERMKGIDEMIALMPRLLTRDPSLRYLVLGDGDDRPRLEAKARELGVAAQVVFAGRIAESEKADHYRLSDVFVMPSRGEGFGFVFLEAMACGIPVVASKIDGGREALRDGELGLLTDPDDPDDIERAILSSLRSPRGVIPTGLSYFSFESFSERVHRWLEAV